MADLKAKNDQKFMEVSEMKKSIYITKISSNFDNLTLSITIAHDERRTKETETQRGAANELRTPKGPKRIYLKCPLLYVLGEKSAS